MKKEAHTFGANIDLLNNLTSLELDCWLSWRPKVYLNGVSARLKDKVFKDQYLRLWLMVILGNGDLSMPTVRGLIQWFVLMVIAGKLPILYKMNMDEWMKLLVAF